MKAVTLLLLLTLPAQADPYRTAPTTRMQVQLRVPRKQLHAVQAKLRQRASELGLKRVGFRPTSLTRLRLASSYTIELEGGPREVVEAAEAVRMQHTPSRYQVAMAETWSDETRLFGAWFGPAIVGMVGGLAASGGEPRTMLAGSLVGFASSVAIVVEARRNAKKLYGRFSR